MKISGIDKDFVDIVNLLDAKGFKPFASCDGVLDNHSDTRLVEYAYISFLESPQIINLMAAFLRDKDIFNVIISNNADNQPYYLYGNLISGNRFITFFKNQNGDYTSYFKKIISGVIDGNIKIEDNEKENIIELNDILKDDEDSNLHISVNFNSQYQPYMRKGGRINVINILTKGDCEKALDMNSLVEKLSQKYEIKTKKDDLEEEFVEDEFAISSFMGSNCEIYFTDEHIKQALDQIRYIKEIEKSLPYTDIQLGDDIEYMEDDDTYYYENDEGDISK